MPGKGINVAVSAKDRLAARNDLAWAISVGGIGVVGFAALLLFSWHFAATLFLIFAGMLLGVALNAMTNMELSLKVGDGGNRKGGISWGCLTPPLLHRRSDMPCPKITSSS